MPEVASVHVIKALTEISLRYGANEFLADSIAPVVSVNNQSDKFYIIDALKERMRNADVERAPGDEPNSVDFDVSSSSYSSNDHALSSRIPDEERKNADVAIQPEVDRTEFLTGRILLDKEIRLQAAMVAGITTNTSASGNTWADYTNGTPIEDVQTAKQNILDNAHVAANTMVIDSKTWNSLRDHPEIINRLDSGQTPGGPAVASEAAVAKVLDLDQILVARAWLNSANPGATASTATVWGTDAWILHVDPNPGLRSAGVALTFQWNVFGTSGVEVSMRRLAGAKADEIQVHRHYDQKIVQELSGHRITSVIS